MQRGGGWGENSCRLNYRIRRSAISTEQPPADICFPLATSFPRRAATCRDLIFRPLYRRERKNLRSQQRTTSGEKKSGDSDCGGVEKKIAREGGEARRSPARSRCKLAFGTLTSGQGDKERARGVVREPWGRRRGSHESGPRYIRTEFYPVYAAHGGEHSIRRCSYRRGHKVFHPFNRCAALLLPPPPPRRDWGETRTGNNTSHYPTLRFCSVKY